MKSAFLILTSLAILPAFAGAAVVEFVNGDRLTGEPAGVENGRLRLVTPHCGVVFADVTSIASVDGAPLDLVTLSATGHRDGVREEVEVLAESTEAEAPAWVGQIELGAHLNSGNSDNRGFHVKLGAVKDTEEYRLEGTAHALYAEEDDERIVNEQFVGLRGDLKDLPWYYFAILSAEKDEFEDLDLRAIFAPGVGYVLSDTDRFLARIEAGPTLTWVDYVDDDGELEIEARVGFHAEARVFEKAKLLVDLQLFPSLTESGEFRLVSEAAFEQPLSEELYFKLSVLDTYNSDVPSGVKKNDLRILGSLVFKF